jgi:hypothetical protein
MKSRAPLLGRRATDGRPPNRGVAIQAAALGPLPSPQLGGLCGRAPQVGRKAGPAHNCPPSWRGLCTPSIIKNVFTILRNSPMSKMFSTSTSHTTHYES